MKLLHIDSSARGASVTRRLTAQFAQEWKKHNRTGQVVYRDLAATTFPLITDEWGATFLDPSSLTPGQRSYLAVSDQLIEELQSADVVVIGAPMYNFTVPVTLKAWIDQIVRLGKTFSYGKTGPQGLLRNTKVIVITARGGSYEKNSSKSALDFQEPYLRFILAFVGLTDVSFIHAENQANDHAPASLAAAGEQISAMVARNVSQIAAQ